MKRMLTTGVWLLLLSLLLASCTSGSRYVAIPPTVTPDPLHRSDPRLIQNPPDDILTQFTLDSDGYIIDGPRSRPNEPVDHTALMTNAMIADSFAKVALTGGEEFEIEFAHPDGDRLSKSLEGRVSKYNRDLGQMIFYRGGLISAPFYQSLDRSTKLISKNTRLGVSMLHRSELQEFLMYFFLKDQKDAQKVADDFREMAAEKALETEGYYGFLTAANIFDSIVREDLASCFAFPMFDADGSRSSTLVVFFLSLPDHQLDSCAYEETIQSMGLFNDDDSLFNTMFTDSFKAYLHPTELDWMMLRILYDDRIKDGMAHEEAMPIVRRILSETRPHGEQ